jgi:hypothetical protein
VRTTACSEPSGLVLVGDSFLAWYLTCWRSRDSPPGSPRSPKGEVKGRKSCPTRLTLGMLGRLE